MPYRYATYQADGKDWCYCCGTRPRYCGNGCMKYFPSPPKVVQPSKELQEIKRKEEELKLKQQELKKKQQELNKKEAERMEQEKNSQISYSSLSSKNAERNRERFTCSLTAELMKHPFDLPCGHCFQEHAIREWLNKNGTCPMCRQQFKEKDLRRNLMCQQSIEEFLQKVKRKEAKDALQKK